MKYLEKRLQVVAQSAEEVVYYVLVRHLTPLLWVCLHIKKHH